MRMTNPEPDPIDTARTASLRQVRVRPASAYLYPTLSPEEWLPAASVATRLLAESVRTRNHDPRPIYERILPEQHFEFRGGQREVTLRQRPRARTRWSDYPSSSSA